MANINEAFNNNSELFYTLNNDNKLDHFFTQRRVVEFQSYIDKNMTRQKKKNTLIYSFLAINLPVGNANSSRYDSYVIEIQAWGNLGYHYKGSMTANEGENPHLLIKLKGDKQIFINLIIKKDGEVENFTSFIQVPKRYQTKPEQFANTNKDIDGGVIDDDDDDDDDLEV